MVGAEFGDGVAELGNVFDDAAPGGVDGGRRGLGEVEDREHEDLIIDEVVREGGQCEGGEAGPHQGRD